MFFVGSVRIRVEGFFIERFLNICRNKNIFIQDLHRENSTYIKIRILKSADGDGSSCQRYTYAYSNPLAGKAKFIHTYNADGNPLPSFEGEPKTLELPDVDIDTLTDVIWKNLNEDNKVSLFVRYIDIESGETETRIVNKNK